MEDDLDNSELETATRVLKARMARTACFHMDRVDARTAIALQISGAFKRGAGPASIPKDVLEIVSDATHPRRVSSTPGPLIFYRDITKSNHQYALDTSTMVLSDKVDSRLAAVTYLEGIAALEPPRLVPRTKRILQEKRADVIDPNPDRWQPAALQVYDAVRDDLLCQLDAVEQSLEQHFEDGLREYFPKVLRPSISSLEALEIKLVKPSEQVTDMMGMINACADQNTLEAACDKYQHMMGFLPLGSDYSLTRVVQLWRERHNVSINLWEQLWAWTDTTQSPLARYHVCKLFLARPGWCVQGCERLLWEEILEIISNPTNEDKTLRWRHAWTVRKELAQHYLHFLESRAPGAWSEALATFAWWLADRVAKAIGQTTEVMINLRNVAIIPDAQNSDFAWRLSLPRTMPSNLAKATHLGASPWALSILNQMTSETLVTLGPGLDQELVHRFERGLAAVIMFGYLVQPSHPADGVYAFETMLSEFVNAWRAYREDSPGAEVANAIAAMYEKLSNPGEFVPALKKICEEDHPNQMIIAQWAIALAIKGLLPREEVWKCLTDDGWRKPTFMKVTEGALDQLFLAFSLGMDRNDNTWKVGLSHLYATACEEATEDPERRRLLFMFTVLSGIHTYSVSAIQRLLAGSQRATYLDLLSSVRNGLSTSRNIPPWLTARIRAVLAVNSAI
jgi:hypothetical protein